MQQASDRAPIAIICNSVPPYRLHLHRRIAREMPGIRLWTVQTHEDDGRWTDSKFGEEIGFVKVSAGITCSVQGTAPREEWRLGRRLIDWVKENKIRAVIICGYNDLARLRLLIWCRGHGVPVMLSADSNVRDARNLYSPKQIIKWIVLRLFLGLFNAVLPFGTAGRAYFRRFGVADRKIFHVPLEPDYSLIEQVTDAQRAAARQQFGLAEDRRRILFCGRLSLEMERVKRVDLLIDAFVRIAPRRHEWDLVVLGGGPLQTQYEQRTPTPLRDRVKFLGHCSDQSLVSAVQRCCDVLALPGDREAWGLVVNEAMAAGMTVVISRIVGCADDLVRDGVSGFAIPPGDVGKLAEALERATDPSRLSSLQEGSKKLLSDFRSRFDPIAGLTSALESVDVV